MAFGLEKKLKERCDIFLLVFIGVSRRTGTNVECPREMNLGSLEELLWIIVMYLRIDLYFSRNICNILIISQMSFSVYMSKHSRMNSWEWHWEEHEEGEETLVTFVEKCHCPKLEQIPGPQESLPMSQA